MTVFSVEDETLKKYIKDLNLRAVIWDKELRDLRNKFNYMTHSELEFITDIKTDRN